MQYLKKWPQWIKIVFITVLMTFWFNGFFFAKGHGNKPYFYTDETTEMMTIFAAKHYLEHGFFENYLLPTYPPFGHAPGGKMRDEPFVYHHYLAGSDLTNAAFLKIVGVDHLWLARMIPHTLTIIAMGWLAVEFAALMNSPISGLLFLALLFVPKSLRSWSIALYGHSYVMAFYLYMVAGLLRLANQGAAKTVKKEIWPWAFGFAIGWLQMFFDLDWVPLTFVSAAAIICLIPRISAKSGRAVLISMVIGGTAAVGYQLAITSLYLGSVSAAIQNTAEWMSFRAGTTHVENVSFGDFRLHKVLHEYNRQAYGATGFTAWNLVALSAAFMVMGFLGKLYPRTHFMRSLLALVLAYLSATIWNIGMRQHSVAHIHFLPRHYFALYMFFALSMFPIAYALIMRSRAAAGRDITLATV